jgi:hypothetical protein
MGGSVYDDRYITTFMNGVLKRLEVDDGLPTSVIHPGDWYEERDHGEFRTKRLVLEIYDAMADAARTGQPYQTILDLHPATAPANLHLTDPQ